MTPLVNTASMSDLELLDLMTEGRNPVSEPWYRFEGRSVADLDSTDYLVNPALKEWREKAVLEQKEALFRLMDSDIAGLNMDERYPMASAFITMYGAPGLGSVKDWARRRLHSLHPPNFR